MKKNIIQLTESDLRNIVIDSVKKILKEDNYGLVSGDNTGKVGLKKVKILNKIKNDLINGQETSYELPIDFNNVLRINIKSNGNNVYEIETNYGSFKQVGVENTLNLINNLQNKIINQKSNNN